MNMITDASHFVAVQMSERDFQRFSAFIYEQIGIHLPAIKKILIESRLQKRLRRLGIASYTKYLDYLFSQEGLKNELLQLIDVVTTNTTDFFREPKHFEFLEQTLLPEWVASGHTRPLRVWSAGCSSGMEPYTLAMVFSEFAERHPRFSYSILGSDISTKALEQAIRGVYDEERLGPVPKDLKKKYFLRSRNPEERLVRVVPELRRKIIFRRLNFVESFRFIEPLDIIFCRNVVIYFDHQTQEQLFRKFCGQMETGGHLFIGHSESLSGMALPLKQIQPTIYRRIESRSSE